MTGSGPVAGLALGGLSAKAPEFMGAKAKLKDNLGSLIEVGGGRPELSGTQATVSELLSGSHLCFGLHAGSLREMQANTRPGRCQYLSDTERHLPVLAGAKPHRPQRPRQILRHRRDDPQPLAGLRMIERQLQGVEGQAVEPEALAEEAVVLALAVAYVADQGMTQVLEVAADLVEAAGQRTGLDESVAFAGCQPAELRDGRHPRPSRRPRHRMIDHPFLGRDAAHQGEIALLHFASRELLLQPPRSGGIEGEQQGTAGGPVEAMHRIDPLPNAVQDDDPLAGQSAVDGDPRRLVDGEQEAVAVEDGQIGGRAHRLPDSLRKSS